MIQVGQTLPQVTLKEYQEAAADGSCSAGPIAVDALSASAGKKIVIFAVPGAFTPTCSVQHAPGYVTHVEDFKKRGVDEIWCVSVNDAFVMGAWARDQKAAGKVKMLADGSAEFAKALGLSQDLTAAGLGIRSLRYAMVVENGKVQQLFVEAPGKFEVSSAQAVLAKLS